MKENLFSLNKVLKDKNISAVPHREDCEPFVYVPCAPGRRLEPLLRYLVNVHTWATGEGVRKREDERWRSEEEQKGGEVRPLFSLTVVGKLSLFSHK